MLNIIAANHIITHRIAPHRTIPDQAPTHHYAVCIPRGRGGVRGGCGAFLRRALVPQEQGGERRLGQGPPVGEERGLGDRVGEEADAFAVVRHAGPHLLRITTGGTQKAKMLEKKMQILVQK